MMFKHGEVEDKPEEGQLYYSLSVTPTYAGQIMNKKMEFYEIDGKKVFEVRNEAGQVVGYRMFILFKD